ncbi:MAG: phosphomannomutase [Myxococcota bacterium]|jgi:phosphomannomutase
MSETLISLARRWMAADPNPATRAETEAIIASGEGLTEAFGARLEFGTAGIRGRMGPGPGQMNRALVRQVTAGIAAYLLKNEPDAATMGVVIGFDGRHNSLAFAEDAAAVLSGAGLKVYQYDVVVATPTLAHAVLALSCAAGIMVTASHNPPADNGYKVYWSNGAQIISPHDKGISAEIDAVGGPWGVALPERAEVHAVPTSVWTDYVAAVLAGRIHRVTGAVAVYTAMHGVGYAPLAALLDVAGHGIIAVPQQRDPDGDFPTVAFPNPEEDGAMDLSLALARESSADLVLANDPDADRLSVAVPDIDGTWRQLTGNEVGLLLADELLTHGAQGGDRLVVTTVVSTSLLARVAQAHGARLAETLTGFKWIANKAMTDPGDFVMGFEESLGYSVGDVVRDKDGLSAALHILDLASDCKARGTTLMAHLTALYRRYGYVASAQKSIKMPGLEGAAKIRAVMDGLRAAPPSAIAGLSVVRIRDVAKGTSRDLATGGVTPLDLPASNVIAFDLAEGCRVLARPSGTEPKIKFYFEAREVLSEGEPLAAAQARAEARMDAMYTDFFAQAGLA